MARRRSHHGNPTKTIGTAYVDYVKAIVFAWKHDYYLNGMAKFFGVKADEIKSATPVQNWNKFASNVLTYAKVWAQNLGKAFNVEVKDSAINSWNTQIPQQVLNEIQGGGGGGAVVAGGGATGGGGGAVIA